MEELKYVRSVLDAFFTVAMNKADFETCELVKGALEKLTAFETKFAISLIPEEGSEPNYRDKK